jgi:hypothetical protein
MAGYVAPTEEQVREALRRIPTLQLRRAFFEGLKNPLWVTPLAKAGAFQNPPDPEITSDGLIRDVYWPEINYLIRVAPEVPAAVVDVLLKLKKSRNAWFRRGVFAIGASIPADEAARLQPLIRSWVSSGFGWRTDPREVVGLAVNLLQGGQYEVGKWFAGLLFKPVKTPNGRKRELEDYWYEDGLPRVVAALGDDGLSVVLPWLVAYERSESRLKRGSDITYVSRDSIRSRSDSHESVEQALIDAVRDLAIKAMLLDAKEATSSLLKAKMILARKIALFALAEAIKRVTDDDDRMNVMLRVAADLLFEKSSLNDSCRIEYAELARAVASRSAETLEPLPGFIDTALNVDNDRLRQWLGRDDAEGSVVDERVRDYNERTMHRWLSAIGADALPERLRVTLATLDGRFGVIESPLQPEKTVSMWSGPNSPITQDEMSIMSPAELVAHLESWHDTGNGWGPEPSHEGQGRELTALLTTNPKALAGIDDLVARLRPTYLRAILQGWSAALKADLEPDWHQVVEVTQGVLTHSDESAFPVEGDPFDDDANFRMVKQAAVRLLEEVAQRRSALKVPEEVVALLADMLVTQAADETAWSEYISHDDTKSGMDPLTVSLNWQWPVRLRGLIYLMHGSKDAPWYGPARSALERELSREDTRGASRAVLGEGLGRLLDTDPEWLKPKSSAWFGNEEGSAADQQIVLTTAMAVHRYHPKLYELLSPSMIGAIRVENPLVAGWRAQPSPLVRIGEWVINAIILGHKELKDPVAHAFFTTAQSKVRGEAIGRIAWAFMHAERVDDTVRDRLAKLWDVRVEHVRYHPEDKEELSEFFWFVKSGKFDATWWLPRLKDAIELNPQLTHTQMIGNEIKAAASIDSRGALDVLRLLLKESEDIRFDSYDLVRNAVPFVLAQAISSGDIGLKDEALALMNQLGERGHLGLESEVNEMLKGEGAAAAEP